MESWARAVQRLDRRTQLLLAMFPFVAVSLLNYFWKEELVRAGGWSYHAADAAQWLLVPALTWLLVLRPAGIKPPDYGLHGGRPMRRPAEAIFVCLAACTALWISYWPVEAIASVVFLTYASTYSYAAVSPDWYPAKLAYVAYLAITAGLFEEIVWRGMAFAWFRSAFPRAHTAWFVFGSALLFAAAHLEQGPHGVIASFTFGLMAAVLYRTMGNLWPLVIGHAVNDLIAFWPQ